MKKIIIATLIGATSLISAMHQQITFRSPDAIKADLEKIGATDRAIERLNVHKEFGSQTMTIQQFETKMAEICEDRIQATPAERRERARQHVQQKVGDTIAILLNEHPEALKLINQKKQELK